MRGTRDHIFVPKWKLTIVRCLVLQDNGLLIYVLSGPYCGHSTFIRCVRIISSGRMIYPRCKDLASLGDASSNSVGIRTPLHLGQRPSKFEAYACAPIAVLATQLHYCSDAIPSLQSTG